MLQPSTVSKRKRRRAVRNVGDDLKQRLITVREEVYKERPSFGIRFLCHVLTIFAKKPNTLKVLKIQYS